MDNVVFVDGIIYHYIRHICPNFECVIFELVAANKGAGMPYRCVPSQMSLATTKTTA
jgi:hypothetical protein